MTRSQLEHAIRAACDVSADSELYVLGSQAILGERPDAVPDLRASIEVDVQPVHRPDAIDAIDAALGELSLFRSTYGFYVHGVSIDAATLPLDWELRTVTVSDAVGTRGNIGRCLETHDLASSKLAAYRDKDREFVATLLAEGLIDPEVLRARLGDLPLELDQIERLRAWLSRTTRALDQTR